MAQCTVCVKTIHYSVHIDSPSAVLLHIELPLKTAIETANEKKTMLILWMKTRTHNFVCTDCTCTHMKFDVKEPFDCDNR